MIIRDATRTSCRPLIVFYGESGTGKTLSALYLARGLAGDDGKLVMVETESGRGEAYADVVPPVSNPYKVISLSEPFSPERHVEAIEAAEDAEADAIVVDSGSHEWEGAGGVLSQAAAVEEKSGRPGLHCWNKPKFAHGLFLAKLLRCACPIIVCLRAKHKSRQVKDDKGKTVIVKDEQVTPIQAEDFLFEATIHAEIRSDHTLNVTKMDQLHPELAVCFPQGQKITIDHGRHLAKWCAGSTVAMNRTNAQKKASHKQQAWTLLKYKHGGDPLKFRQWLVDELVIRDDVALGDITAAEWPSVLEKIQSKLEAQA